MPAQPVTLRSWRGRRILLILGAVALLDFIAASITNVALPHILRSLHFSMQSLQWGAVREDPAHREAGTEQDQHAAGLETTMEIR